MINQEDNDRLNELIERARKKSAERNSEMRQKNPEEMRDRQTCSKSQGTLTPEDLEYAGIYRRYQSVSFAAIETRGLPDDKCITDNYQRVVEYADNLDEYVKSGYGMILLGGYGVMKTTMAIAVLRKWLDAGHHGLIVPMCSLVDNLYTMMSLNREEMARYERRLRAIPLLVLDDLGGENTDQRWVLGKVDSIITERYNKLLPTIVTSNLTAKELADTYSGRVIDRLKNTTLKLVFDAPSQRRHLWEE